MASSNIDIYAKLHSEGVKKGADESKEALKGMASQIGIITTAAGLAAATIAVYTRELSKGIAIYKADEKALMGFSTALRISGKATDESKRSILEYIKALELTTGIDDTALMRAFQTLVTATGSADEALDALHLSVNIASSDLEGFSTVQSAATAVARVFGGNIGELGEKIPTVARAIKELSSTATPLEKAAVAMAAMKKEFPDDYTIKSMELAATESERFARAWERVQAAGAGPIAEVFKDFSTVLRTDLLPVIQEVATGLLGISVALTAGPAGVLYAILARLGVGARAGAIRAGETMPRAPNLGLNPAFPSVFNPPAEAPPAAVGTERSWPLPFFPPNAFNAPIESFYPPNWGQGWNESEMTLRRSGIRRGEYAGIPGLGDMSGVPDVEDESLKRARREQEIMKDAIANGLLQGFEAAKGGATNFMKWFASTLGRRVAEEIAGSLAASIMKTGGGPFAWFFGAAKGATG